MDVAALAAAFMGAQAAQTQSGIQASIMKTNADAEKQVVAMLEAGQQNLMSLANVGAGIGQNLNISA